MAQHPAIEQTIINASGVVTKGSGVTAVASGAAQKIAEDPSWLSMADYGVVAGIAGVILGLIVSTFFQWRKDKRDREFHEARMRELNSRRQDG